MKKIERQKTNRLALAVVVSILAVVMLATIVILDMKVNASTCTDGGEHTWGEWTNSGVGVHVRYCEVCENSEAQECDDYSSWVSYGEDGHHWKCSVCGGFTMPREHNYADTFSIYTSASTRTERHGRVCSDCGGYVTDEHDFVQGSTINGICAYSGCGLTCEACDGDGPTSGTCSVCGMSSCDHVVTYMDYNDTKHWQVCSDCGETLTSKESHDFVGAACSECDYVCNHDGETGSECSNCGTILCEHDNLNYTYWQNEIHEATCIDCGNSFLQNCVLENTWTQLSSYHVKACKYCDEVLRQGAHDSNGTGGTCSVCGYQTHTHSYTSNVVAPTCTTGGYTVYTCCCGYSYTGDTTTALGHDVIAATCTEASKCKRTGCTHTTGAALGHDMSTATCTEASKCKRTGCTHTTGTALGHDMAEATCTEAAKCQRTGCTHTEGAALGHDMAEATCTEASKCKRTGCTHTEGAALGHNWTGTTWTSNGDGTHTGTCTNCTQTDTKDCTYGTENKCTECGYTMSSGTGDDDEDEPTHTCTPKATWEKNATHHWKICSDTACNKEIADTRVAHNDTNSDNLCDTCGYTMSSGAGDDDGDDDEDEPTHTCTPKTTWEKNATHHWKICSDTTCNKEITGTRGTHSDTNSDGVCDVCRYSMQGGTENPCNHEITTSKKDDTYHWDECNNCGKELNKEEHKYTDGKCKCGKQEETKECTHTNKEWKSDENEHWQVCKDCGKEISGTRKQHNYVDGACENCGEKQEDKTATGTTIPDTGAGKIVLIVVIAVIGLIGSSIGVKRYKEI